MSALKRTNDFLYKPVSASTLVAFRFFFGSIMLWEVTRYWPRIKRYYLDPTYLFKYDFFHWVKVLPGDWMYVHFVVTGIAAACVALGLFYRSAATILFLGFSYIFLLEQANYLNHIYFVNLVAFLMIFVSANCCYSLDARFVPEIRSSVVPRWNVAILQFQIGVVYFFGGIAKINWDWFCGEPLRNWLAKRGDYEYIGPYLTQWWSPYFFSWSGLLLDLFVPFLLLWKRTRLLAVAGVLTFHLLNSQIFTIGIFPWMMLAATLIFFEPDSLKKWLPSWPEPLQILPTPSRLITLAIGLYCLIQVMLPLRHHLFPGDVAWNEEGHRFAWRMKLRDKSAALMFIVEDLDTRQTHQIHPVRNNHINRRQFDSMSGRPDMFYQYVQLLKKKISKEGIKRYTIKARYFVSVNGRQHQEMVDPELDLTTITYSPFTHSEWINPLNKNLPPGEYSRVRLYPSFNKKHFKSFKKPGTDW